MHRAQATDAAVLGTAGQRGHVEVSARADLDVGGHRLEAVARTDGAGGQPVGAGDLLGHLRHRRGQDRHGGDAAGAVDREHGVGARVGDVHGVADAGRRVGVGLDDPVVVRGADVLRQLGLALPAQVGEAVGHVPVGVVAALVAAEVGQRTIGAVAPDLADLPHLVVPAGDGVRHDAPAHRDGADLSAAVGPGDQLPLPAGPDPGQQPGEVLRDVHDPALGDGEAQRGHQAVRLGARGRVGGGRGRGWGQHGAGGQRAERRGEHEGRDETVHGGSSTVGWRGPPRSRSTRWWTSAAAVACPVVGNRCCATSGRRRTPRAAGRRRPWQAARRRAPRRGPRRAPRAPPARAAGAGRARRAPSPR